MACTLRMICAFVYEMLPGARELFESCVSHNSRSLETEQPYVRLCPSTGPSFGGVTPDNFFATYGQICILSHFLAKMTSVDMGLGKIFSIYTYDV